jgi:3',5'-cyclic AMP phosphodiesterase CpdA
MFVLAHLSDPHLAPLPVPRLAELGGKRVLGYVNWRRKRHKIHRTEQLDLLVRDLRMQAPDHVAVTGDLVNIALEPEFARARAWLHRLGDPRDVTLVPGNHDAYVHAALAAQAVHWREFMQGDGGTCPPERLDREAVEPRRTLQFPFLRRRGPLALVGLSTAVPTGPFMATGHLGAEQIARLDDLLGRLPGLCRAVLIHHPPLWPHGSRFKRLVDAAELRAVLRRRGAELVLHGHHHVHALEWLEGPVGPIPALGVPSASAANDDDGDRAAYNLYRIEARDGACTCEAVTRGMRTDVDGIVELARRELALAHPG